MPRCPHCESEIAPEQRACPACGATFDGTGSRERGPNGARQPGGAADRAPGRRRSERGVGIVAGLLGVLGLVHLGFAALLLDVGGTASGYGVGDDATTITLLGLGVGVAGLALLATAIGVWRGHPRGWWAAVAVIAVGTLATVAGVSKGATGAGSLLALLGYGGAFLALLAKRDEIRTRSRRRQRGTA